MALTYTEIIGHLIGDIPKLPYQRARRSVDQAWKRIQDARQWSFLKPVLYVNTPEIITAGLITCTQGSTIMTVDAAAAAALNAVVFADPPLASPSYGIGRQLRIGNSSSGSGIGNNSSYGPVYSIVSWDLSTLTLTVDHPFSGVSGTTGYSCYKCYYSPPASDFLRYISIVNPVSGYCITKKKLLFSRDQLDRIDPQRGATGDTYILSSFQPTQVTYQPVHEWYPHPVVERTYTALCHVRYIPFNETTPAPTTISDNLIIAAAMVEAAKWCRMQVSAIPELATVNWVQVAAVSEKEYRTHLLNSSVLDDTINPIPPIFVAGVSDFPLGGQFLQNHDVGNLL